MNISEYLIAQVEREIADMRAADAAVAASLAAPSARPRAGASPRLSIRLDPAELDALERRADVRGLKPSVLARNLIRVGLATKSDRDVSEAVSRLEKMVAELRALVP